MGGSGSPLSHSLLCVNTPVATLQARSVPARHVQGRVSRPSPFQSARPAARPLVVVAVTPTQAANPLGARQGKTNTVRIVIQGKNKLEVSGLVVFDHQTSDPRFLLHYPPTTLPHPPAHTLSLPGD